MIINLTGKKFGRLTVIKKYDVVGNGETRWLCSCDCGNENVIVSRGDLKSGNTLSCGCFHKEMVSKARKKYNLYDLNSKYGIGYTTNTNKEFLFDLKNYEIIKEYMWWENDKGYILGKIIGEKKHIRMHRLIKNILNSPNIIIDHKNLCRNDNREENLRFANKQLNGANRGKNKNNKLGIKGVYKKNGKYYSQITKNGHTFYLGTFMNLQEAIKIHSQKQLEFFGEFAYKGVNFNE